MLRQGSAPCVLIFVQLLLAAPCPLRGADWPEFRGPTGQGHASDSDPPVEWDFEKNVAWKTPVAGCGWSSPIVAGDHIFLTTAVQQSQEGQAQTALGPDVSNNEPVGSNSTAASLSLRALALDAKTGRIVWDREVFHYEPGQYPPGHAKNSFASPTPLAHAGKLYVHFGPLGTASLDMQGGILWRNVEVKYDARHGGAGSPVVVGDALVFNCDGVDNPFVIALDCNTGKERWRTPRQPMDPERFAFSTPLAIPSNNTATGLQLVSSGSHMTGSYDPTDGHELWHVYYDRRWSVAARPVYADGIVFACSGGEAPPELLAIKPDGSGNVTGSHVLWRHDSFVPLTSSVIVVGGYLFMVSDAGIAACTDATNGKVVWKKRLGGNFSASPIHAAGRIYFPSDSGVCFVIAAKPEFELLAKNDLGQPTLASFAITDDALLIRTSEALYRVEKPPARESSP